MKPSYANDVNERCSKHTGESPGEFFNHILCLLKSTLKNLFEDSEIIFPEYFFDRFFPVSPFPEP